MVQQFPCKYTLRNMKLSYTPTECFLKWWTAIDDFPSSIKFFMCRMSKSVSFFKYSIIFPVICVPIPTCHMLLVSNSELVYILQKSTELMWHNTLVLVLLSFELNAKKGKEMITFHFFFFVSVNPDLYGTGVVTIPFLQQSFSKLHSRSEMMECTRRVSFVVNIWFRSVVVVLPACDIL